MPDDLIEELEYKKYMNIAINMAKRGVGNTFPNPSVGCVIEKDGVIIGRGWTGNGGRPHAETQAIKSVASNAEKTADIDSKQLYSTENANLYVTLEPCSHFGETPPCVNAIIDAGIKKVVIANGDPNPKVSGKGVKILKDHDIEVIENIGYEEAGIINAAFFKSILYKIPYITLKLALTGDGKISIAKGERSWFTNNIAKSYAHMLRYKNDAILVGSGTLIADNPSLTCRLNGLEKYSPKRFILSNKIDVINDEFNCFPSRVVKGDIKDIVSDLTVNNGITRLLIEGGGETAISFLDADMVDEIHLITAEKVKGDSNSTNILESIAGYLSKYHLSEERNLGDNSLVVYKR